MLAVYLDSIYDFVGSPDVAQADARIAILLYAMRDPRLVAVFGWITALGGWEVVVTMLAGATASLAVLRRYGLAAGLWITALGTQITVSLLKSFFDRPRSALGYFTETSGSFPSGHAASSVAIWGLLFYLAWRMRLLPALAAALAGVTLAFLVGFSRVYLIEHYLSDVLNGYLVGALWLILGVAFCEWRRDRDRPASPDAGPRLRLACSATALTLALSIALASILTTPLNPPAPPSASPTGTDIASRIGSGDLPRLTRTLIGEPHGPIDFTVEAMTDLAITSALEGAGLTPADRPGIGILARAFWADWTGTALPQPLVIPTFWNDRPNDLGFSRIESAASDAPRLHVRIWRTGRRTSKGGIVFVGAIAREDPLEWRGEDGPGRGPSAITDLTRMLASLNAAGLAASTTAVPDAARHK